MAAGLEALLTDGVCYTSDSYLGMFYRRLWPKTPQTSGKPIAWGPSPAQADCAVLERAAEYGMARFVASIGRQAANPLAFSARQ